MCRSRKTAVSNTVDCRSRYGRCIGTRMRTCTDCDGFILTGGCAHTECRRAHACRRRTRTKGSGQHAVRIGFYTDCNGSIGGRGAFK